MYVVSRTYRTFVTCPCGYYIRKRMQAEQKRPMADGVPQMAPLNTNSNHRDIVSIPTHNALHACARTHTQLKIQSCVWRDPPPSPGPSFPLRFE